MKQDLATVALEINKAYRRGRDGLIEAGNMLLAQQALVGEGNFAVWFRQHKDILGFGRATAFRLMQLAMSRASATNSVDDIWNHANRGLQQSLSAEHYTPAEYIEAAREVLGEIDLDPASCVKANKVVKAKKFFTKEDDGLEQDWSGRVWLNPPYGDSVGAFVFKLRESLKANVSAAIILVNSYSTDSSWFQLLWSGLLCFTHHRINFYGDGERSGSTHGSVFAYFGPKPKIFVKRFSDFGAVVKEVSGRDY
jgi:hypothetical protein